MSVSIILTVISAIKHIIMIANHSVMIVLSHLIHRDCRCDEQPAMYIVSVQLICLHCLAAIAMRIRIDYYNYGLWVQQLLVMRYQILTLRGTACE